MVNVFELLSTRVEVLSNVEEVKPVNPRSVGDYTLNSAHKAVVGFERSN